MGSAMIVPGAPEMASDLTLTSRAGQTFVVSIYFLLSFLGPLLFVPLSEIWGRLPVYHVSNVCWLVFTVGCGFASDAGQLMVFRALAGGLGTACLSIGGGTVADMFLPRDRPKALAAWAMGPLLGPFIGPVVGGYVAEQLGWRWVFHLLSIMVSGSHLVKWTAHD
jgi:MFS family permease